MTKEGALPLCDVGVRFALLKSAETDSQRRDGRKLTAAVRADALRKDRDAQQSSAAVAAKPGLDDDTGAALGRALSKMGEAGARTISKVQKFWTGALTNYPEKFASFQSKMTGTMISHCKYLAKLGRKALAWGGGGGGGE